MLKETIETGDLPRGFRGTDKTIRKMHRLVAQAKLDPTMHRIATVLRLQVPNDRKGSGRQTVEEIFRWLERHGVFQRDQFQIERIEHPVSSMQSIVKARKAGAYDGRGLFVGDCDQFAIWAATLGGILGFQYAFETAKTDLRRPDEFSHVWTALLVGKEWIPVDASTPRAYPGWRPPVGADRLKRWPEKEIGGTMSGHRNRKPGFYHGLANGNGNGNGRGRSHVWEDKYVPQDYIGWGAPKDFDYSEEEPELRDTDPSRLDMLVPPEPITDEASLFREPPPERGHRPSLEQGDESFTTGPRYTPPGPHPYYKTRGQFYPPGSKFNRRVVSDVDRSKVKRGTWYHRNPSDVPVKDVTIAMDRPRALKRKNGMKLQERNGRSIVMRPTRKAAGMAGMGQDATTDATAEAAKEASTSVWDTITSTITKAAEVGANIYSAKLQAKYAEKVADATNRVAGQNVAQPTDYYQPKPEEPSPWYTSPWVWVGGALVVGGTAYVLTRSKSRGGRRGTTRRRRR